MTVEQYIAKQRRLFNELVSQNKPLEIAVRTTMATQAHRIFVDGRKSDGGNIGQYDTKRSMYVNPNYAPRKTGLKPKGIQGLLPTAGKTGEHVFKNGKVHKTTFVNNYKDLKNRIGQRIDKVNYHYTGDLESDFRNAPIDSSAVNPKRINASEYHTVLHRTENSKKLDGLDRKFGVTTNLMRSEKELFLKTLNYELKKHLSQ